MGLSTTTREVTAPLSDITVGKEGRNALTVDFPVTPGAPILLVVTDRDGNRITNEATGRQARVFVTEDELVELAERVLTQLQG
jgi:hypothetical protein